MKRRLNPGGVVTMFVQLYLSNMATVKSEIATFMDVFPNALVWGNPVEGRGYDLVLTAQTGPTRFDVDELQARLDSEAYAQVRGSLRDIGFGSAAELLASYAGSKPDLLPWLSDAAIHTDRNLRLQYLAGLSSTVQESGPIYAAMVRDVKVPPAAIGGSPASVKAVTEGISRALERARRPAGAHPF